MILEGIEKAGYKSGRDKDICIALDPAASEFYDNNKHVYKSILSKK